MANMGLSYPSALTTPSLPSTSSSVPGTLSSVPGTSSSNPGTSSSTPALSDLGLGLTETPPTVTTSKRKRAAQSTKGKRVSKKTRRGSGVEWDAEETTEEEYSEEEDEEEEDELMSVWGASGMNEGEEDGEGEGEEDEEGEGQDEDEDEDEDDGDDDGDGDDEDEDEDEDEEEETGPTPDPDELGLNDAVKEDLAALNAKARRRRLFDISRMSDYDRRSLCIRTHNAAMMRQLDLNAGILPPPKKKPAPRPIGRSSQPSAPARRSSRLNAVMQAAQDPTPADPNQETLGVNGEQGSTPTTPEQDTTPTMGELDTTPTTGEQDATPTTSEQDTTPTTGEQDATPTTSEQDTTPTTSEQDATPTTSEQDTTPTTSEQHTTPTTGEQDATPTTGEKDTTPTTSELDTTPTPVAGTQVLIPAALVDDEKWPDWVREGYAFMSVRKYGENFERAVGWWTALRLEVWCKSLQSCRFGAQLTVSSLETGPWHQWATWRSRSLDSLGPRHGEEPCHQG